MNIGDANEAGTSKIDDGGEKNEKDECRDLNDKEVESSSSSSSSSFSYSSPPMSQSPPASDGDDHFAYIQKLLAQKLNLSRSSDDEGTEPILDTLDFDGLIKHWQTKGFKNIITMVGAGISTCK